MSRYGVILYDKYGREIANDVDIFLKLHAEGVVTVPAAVLVGGPTYTFTAGVVTASFPDLIGLPHLTLVDKSTASPTTVPELNIWPELLGLDVNNHFSGLKIYNCHTSEKTVQYRVWRYVY